MSLTLLNTHVGYNMWVEPPDPYLLALGNTSTLEKGLSRHFKEVHHRDPTGLIFYGIDKLKGHWQGDNKRIKVSQNEARWIYSLGSLHPGGPQY